MALSWASLSIRVKMERAIPLRPSTRIAVESTNVVGLSYGALSAEMDNRATARVLMGTGGLWSIARCYLIRTSVRTLVTQPKHFSRVKIRPHPVNEEKKKATAYGLA